MSDRLTIPEAAAELRCSERTIRRAIKRGDLPALLWGGRYLIARTDMPGVLPDRTTPPPPPPPRKPGGHFSELAREMDAA